jgi:hypothetical protein
MDLVAEYAERYKHHPATVPRLTWHEFLSLVERRNQFQVRDRLIGADAAQLGRPVDDGNAVLRMQERLKLERIAWPGSTPEDRRGV